MHGAVPPLPNTSSQCGAKFRTDYVFTAWYLVKQRDNFILYLTDEVTLQGLKHKQLNSLVCILNYTLNQAYHTDCSVL